MQFSNIRQQQKIKIKMQLAYDRNWAEVGSLLNPRKPNGTNRDNFVQTNPTLLAQKEKIEKSSETKIGEKKLKKLEKMELYRDNKSAAAAAEKSF